MSRTPGAFEATLTKTAAAGGALVSPIFIVALYLVAIYLLLATLGVQQFQARGGGLTPAERLREAVVRKADLVIRQAKWRVAGTRKDYERAKIESEQAATKFAELNGAVASAKTKISTLPRTKEGEPVSEPDHRRATAIASKALATARAFEPQVERLAKKAFTLRSDLQKLEKNLADVPSISAADQTLLRKIERARAQEAVIREYAEIFVGMPKDWLTLILALSMGVFGSTIYVTRVYFGQAQETVTQASWYFIRPLLGAVLALVVYLGMKTGVLVFGARSDGPGADDLNPFAIAFLAVIAGVFSERVYRWLDAVSRQYFGPGLPGQPTRPRWAKGVAREITVQKKSRDKLAEHLTATRNRIDAWIDAKETVPPDIQSLIAVWLDKRADDLFTETAPSKR